MSRIEATPINMADTANLSAKLPKWQPLQKVEI